MLVDVHAHLEYEQYNKDIDKVIERAKKKDVIAIINSGTDQRNNELTLELAKKYSIIKPSLGLYPLEAVKLSEKELNSSLEYIKKNAKRIIAVGEVGLDYTERDKIKEQKDIFQKIISLTEKLKLPILIHSRKAEDDAIEILESSKIKKIIMHCFSGKLKLAKRAENNGWFFSIPTNIVFSSHFQSLVKEVSTNQILTETDSPFLSPIKGERNEPSFIIYSVKKISEIKALDITETENILFMNYQKIFLK